MVMFDWLKKNKRICFISCLGILFMLLGAYSGKTAHPFQKNGAPFRLKLSKAQLVN